MKNLIKQSITALVLSSVLVAPFWASAAETTRPQTKTYEQTTQSGTKPNADFCARITNVKSELNSKLTQLETTRGQKRTEIVDQLKQRHEQRDEEKQTNRDAVKTTFIGQLTKIEATATTDEQKAAVATFKVTVEQAMNVRKAAVDAAQATFKAAESKLVTDREDAIKNAGSTYKTAVAAAIAKAQSDCTAGVAAADVRVSFVASLTAAKAKFHTDVQAVTKIGQQMKDLVQVRNNAVRAANQAFKTTLEQARQTLKAAFPSE